MSVPWASDAYSSGRLLATRHLVNEVPILVSAVYGFPSGPTWPQSRSLTERLLSELTKHIVLGCSGMRIIMGDMNREPEQLSELSLWHRLGWREAQSLAEELWQQPIQPTCRHTTRVDQLWTSPEVVMRCKSVGLADVFADHSSLFVDLDWPAQPRRISTWPQPSKIDWDNIDVARWHSQLERSPFPRFHGGSTTEYLSKWAQHWEGALAGCHKNNVNGNLPPQCLGRAQRTQPIQQEEMPPMS